MLCICFSTVILIKVVNVYCYCAYAEGWAHQTGACKAQKGECSLSPYYCGATSLLGIQFWFGFVLVSISRDTSNSSYPSNLNICISF